MCVFHVCVSLSVHVCLLTLPARSFHKRRGDALSTARKIVACFPDLARCDRTESLEARGTLVCSLLEAWNMSKRLNSDRVRGVKWSDLWINILAGIYVWQNTLR